MDGAAAAFALPGDPIRRHLDDACEFDIPGKLDDEVAAGLQAMAVSAFRSLDCQGLARVDFL